MTADNVKTRILGIDPGYGRVGWGVIEGVRNKWTHVAHGCIETSMHEPFLERLLELEKALKDIIYKYQPDRAGGEDLYFAKNVKTAPGKAGHDRLWPGREATSREVGRVGAGVERENKAGRRGRCSSNRLDGWILALILTLFWSFVILRLFYNFYSDVPSGADLGILLAYGLLNSIGKYMLGKQKKQT